MTEQILSTRTAVLACMLGALNGCVSSQEGGVSEPNEVAAAEQDLNAPAAANPPDIALASDTNWAVYNNQTLEQSSYLGKAQRVCANATDTTQCPEGAVYYSVGGHGWSGRIDACEGNARWIWAPGITGASAPAELAEYYFVNHVSLSSRPASAKIHLAVDDQAEVIINGTSIGTLGSTTDINVAWASQINPTALDITSALTTGPNTITIRAANGAGAFGNCANCTYEQNPAGVVFCVDIWYKKGPGST